MVCRIFYALMFFTLIVPVQGCGPATRVAENINPDEPEPPTDPAEMERLEKEMESVTTQGDGSDLDGPPT